MKDAITIIKQLREFMLPERADQIERVVQQRTRYLTVVLEDLYQTHNASAVMRSCDCFGVQDVHIIEHRHRFEYNQGIAMGAGKWLHTFNYTSGKKGITNATKQCLETLKSKGYKIAATSPHIEGYTIATVPIDQPIALVFGTELEGISQDAIDQADYLVRIPMYGFTESFNISVAAAIALYELTERIRSSSCSWSLSDQELLDLHLEWVMKSVRDSDAILKRLEEEGL
ncbi:MAG: hypothetical protein RL226_192 [Bacteroidota bacterium]|jgi:tRNA (guanosine-2'-O-)-methyltransferase